MLSLARSCGCLWASYSSLTRIGIRQVLRDDVDHGGREGGRQLRYLRSLWRLHSIPLALVIWNSLPSVIDRCLDTSLSRPLGSETHASFPTIVGRRYAGHRMIVVRDRRLLVAKQKESHRVGGVWCTSYKPGSPCPLPCRIFQASRSSLEASPNSLFETPLPFHATFPHCWPQVESKCRKRGL